MATWRIKEISDLTQISIRMLRHYDKLGLLKPSARTANGYRWYSEADLAKLQQIIALKFFGFNLGAIKTMLQQKVGIAEHLQAQQEMLKEQAANLAHAQKALDATLQRLDPSGIPNWNDLISLIERYRMSEELKKTWAGKVFTEDQLKTFVEVRQSFTDQMLKDYQLRWKELIQEVEQHLNQDPKGTEGKRLAEAWMKLLDEAWGKHPEIKQAVDNEYKEGKIDNPPCSNEVANWIEKAAKHAKLIE